MANLTKNNHYLSQMYLDAWKNDNGKLLVHDFLVPNINYPEWQEKSTRSVGSYDSMYIRFSNDGYIDDFEKWFNDEFETPCSISLNKAKNDEELTEDDFNKLIKFVACHYVRSPKFIFKIMEIGRLKGQQILNEEVKRMEQEVKINNKRFYVDEKTDNCIPIRVSNDGENAKIEVLIGKGFYLEMVRYLLPGIINALKEYKWDIFSADIALPTCDNPVCVFNYYGINKYEIDAKLKDPRSIVAFPIAPNKVLIGSQNLERIKERELGLGLCLLLKKIIVENSYRRVIANNEDKDISLIRDRVVDEQLFLNEMKLWKDMEKEYTTTEVSYLRNKGLRKIKDSNNC